MKYIKMTKENIGKVVNEYINYYNIKEDGWWSYDKAYKRIHQIMTMEDSLCLIQTEDSGEYTGFVMGYYKEYDDIRTFYIEEILIFSSHNRGYGSLFLEHIEKIVKENEAEIIEFICINDKHHLHFYNKNGYTASDNIILMGKHIKD